MNDFVKLSTLIDSEFTVEKVLGYKFKRWDNAQQKMLVSDTYEKGYSKKYQVITDKGQLDLGSGQLGNCLEAVMHGGKADMIGVTYAVKSNGKQGMDIRYYLNPVKKPTYQASEFNEPEFDESGAPLRDF